MIIHNITEKQLTEDIKDSHAYIDAYINKKPIEELNSSNSYSKMQLQLFGNENSAYLEYMNENGKSLLTIASSFDSIFDFICLGTTDITTIDINRKQFYIGCLKIWALENLSYDEYMKFLVRINYAEFLDNFTYQRITRNVDDKDIAKKYWDSIFCNYRNKNILKGLFHVGRFLNEGDNFKLRYKYSSHLIEYASARSRLKNANIKFICDDIVNINKYNLSRNTFDNITLSNVGDFIDNQVYFNLVVNELMPLLTERGKMMVAYLIQISSANINKLKAIDFSNSKMIENGYLLIKKQLELIEMFNKLNPKWSDFATGDGRNLNHYKDSVLVLRK